MIKPPKGHHLPYQGGELAGFEDKNNNNTQPFNNINIKPP